MTHSTQNYQLSNLISDTLGKKAVWGADECFLFVADAVLIETGNDLAKDYRGKYTTKNEAYRLLLQRGSTPQEALHDLLISQGWATVAVDASINGDVGLIMENDAPTMAYRIDQGWLVRSECGIGVRAEAVVAWRRG